MRQNLTVVLFAALTLLTCSRNDSDFGAAQLKLETKREKFSYALGYDFGRNMENIKSGVDLKYFMRGLEDYFKEKPALLDERARQDIRSEEFSRIGQEFTEKQKEAELKKLQEGEAFLKANKSRPGVITTASGLQYQILTEGRGPSPGPNDRIKIKQRGTFLSGKEFDNSDRLAKGHSMYMVSGVFPGWTEAFQLMRVGGKYRFFIPSELAYGKIGHAPDIPPNALLIYEIELLEIVDESH